MSVTRVSSRVEFARAEFNGAGAISHYIDGEAISIGCSKPIVRVRQHARLAKRDYFVLRLHEDLRPIDTGETTMVSFKAFAAVVLLSTTAATPAFAQDRAQYIKNLHDSGYNPKNDFNPNGTIRAAIQEPGLFAFYYPNLDVLNGGEPTPAARLSRDWPALRGACAAIGGGVTYCGERSGSYAFAPNVLSRSHGRRRH
jgi:hypothetical protein